jgi:hypothetical protein
LLHCDQSVQQAEPGIRPVLGLKPCSEGFLCFVHQGQFGGDGFDFSELLNLRIGQLLLRFQSGVLAVLQNLLSRRRRDTFWPVT